MNDHNIRPSNCDSSMDSMLKKMTEEMQTSNRAVFLHNKLQRIGKTRCLKENIEKVFEFDKECEQNGLKVSTRYVILLTLHNLCQYAGPKPFLDLEKKDIIGFLEACKCRKFEDTRKRAIANPGNVEKQLSQGTMTLNRLRIKRFYQWLHGMGKGEYPDNVKWIVIKPNSKAKKLSVNDLPTQEEVLRMIEQTKNPRDRALISILAESGARAGEISVLRIKDISWNQHGFVLRLNGKTGQREIPLCTSIADVKNWINNFHPFKNDPEAPVFTSYANMRQKTNLKIDGIGGIVRQVAIRAGAEKRIHIHPHLFRHLRASQLAEAGWNEMMLRQYFGWSKNSNMPSVYIHLSKKALNNKYYQMYGKAGVEDEVPRKLEENKPCPHCGIRNPTGYVTCFSCGLPISRETAARVERQREVTDTLNFIAKDSELSEKLLQLVAEAKEKQEGFTPNSSCDFVNTATKIQAD